MSEASLIDALTFVLHIVIMAYYSFLLLEIPEGEHGHKREAIGLIVAHFLIVLVNYLYYSRPEAPAFFTLTMMLPKVCASLYILGLYYEEHPKRMKVLNDMQNGPWFFLIVAILGFGVSFFGVTLFSTFLHFAMFLTWEHPGGLTQNVST